MPTLRYRTPDAWTQRVLADFDAFLNDHAAAEKKASGMALSMALHYHDRPDIVATMARAGLGFLDRSISDNRHRSLGRIVARGEDDETTETEPFTAIQGQGGLGSDAR